MTDTSKPSHAHHADSGADTSASSSSVHQDFHWVEGPEQGSPYANFLETTLDIVGGLHTCLQIAYASDLEHEANRDADEGETVAAAISIVESDQLVRLSIAATGLLREEARRRVEVLNT